MTATSLPLKLAYFSPLPPQRSGVSDYSRDLLPHLANWAELHLFIDDYAPTDTTITWRFPIRPHREFFWRNRAQWFDAAVYHLGNSSVHRYLYPYISSHPGILVLHELVVHHLLAGMAMDAGEAGCYLREMAYAAGDRGVRTAWEVLAGQRHAPFFEEPLCERAVAASLGVIVHSDFLRAEVERRCPSTPVGTVRMGIPLPPHAAYDLPDERRAGLRRRLGLPHNAFVLGSLGEATHHKRLDVALRAFARLLGSEPGARYVIAGNVAPGLDLAGFARSLGIERQVVITGAVSTADYDAYLETVDVCINLRYPTAGETSASALRSMAAGQPVIVSGIGANREFPDTCCIKLPVGGDEELLLAGLLVRLAGDAGLRGRLARNARAYVAQRHRLQDAARGYMSFIEGVLGQPGVFPGLPAHAAGAARLPDRPWLADTARALGELGANQGDLPFLQDVAAALHDLGTGAPEEEHR